ncbi:nuclear transport factor 2 family protein [Streptomyces microflavus]|uniref:nuclear transport factor 2 family protein n=1 Tax=Streptomyces microflavus TaxID=1919 RepID=UPI0037F37241
MTTVTAHEAAKSLFEQLLSGASPDELAQRFDEDVDWFIPGDTSVVPWIGRKTGRDGVAEFYAQLGRGAKVKHFQIDTIIGDGDRCVVLGSLRTEVLATGRDIESDFAYDIEVRDGLITRYRMFEDTLAVVRAFEPKAD